MFEGRAVINRKPLSLFFALGLVALLLSGRGADQARAQITGGLGGFGGGFGGGAGGGGGTTGTTGTSGGTSGGTTGTTGTTGSTGNNSGGILVDSMGVVKPMFNLEKTGRLDKKRRHELAGKSLPGDLNTHSPLRKISLVQLEAACEAYARDKKHVTSEMQYLAGLQRIDYVFVYPEEKDLVLAGPAEGYLIDGFGRAVGVSTGRPAIRLDDLIVALRAIEFGGGTIRCSIDPKQENLAKLAAFVSKNSYAATLEESKAQFQQLGTVLGMQDVSLGGVPAESHFAELLVEADIRMKRSAIGVEGLPVKGFRSHLSMVGPDGNSVQRWWFTPLYGAFVKSEDSLAFQFTGQRVQLMSQEELVSNAGQRSDAPFARVSTQKFSKQFTDRFSEIADATPVFAELQNVFDLAVFAALAKRERLGRKVGWPMSLFLDSERATIVRRNVPHQVDSVSNFKVLGGKTFVSQVTGGVSLDPWQVIKHNEYRKDSGGELKTTHDKAVPQERPEAHRWWWD
jgi:hypothetical protein